MGGGLDAEVVVLGAGVVGAACALRLADAGRDVLLLDASQPGQGASFGNAGHIATEQVFPLASPEVVGSAWRYLAHADSPLKLRAAYLLPILPWLARFVWAARPAGFARGVAALVALQQTAGADTVDLFAHAGLGHLLHMDGHFCVWETAVGQQQALAQAARLRPLGVPSQAVPAGQVFARASALGPAVGGAVYYPHTGHVDDPQAICTGLAGALVRAGGRVRQARVLRLAQQRDGPVELALEQGLEQGERQGLEQEQGQAQRLRPGQEQRQGQGRQRPGAGQQRGPGQGQVLRCRQLVLCAGAWSKPLAASLGYRVPLDTERGYHITVPWSAVAVSAAAPASAPAPAPAAAPARIDLPVASTERNVIMTPMSMGLRMTGTVEFGGLHLPPDARRHSLLRRQMLALVPGTQVDQASTWMGFRPSLPDHLPVICAAPRHRGVFFAFGHQHLGLTLAAVTARLVAELVQGGAASIDLAPYHVGRFAGW